MATKSLPSPEDLRKYLSYDPCSGKLTWLPRTDDMFSKGTVGFCKRWNTKYAGKPALNYTNAHGYLVGPINGNMAAAHRVAYAIMIGLWPIDNIDHINGNRTDNRWENIRAASNSENVKNSSRRSDNSSGFGGVDWHPQTKKWRARISVNNCRIHVGMFECKDEAIAARKRANIEYGFTDRHGT